MDNLSRCSLQQFLTPSQERRLRIAKLLYRIQLVCSFHFLVIKKATPPADSALVVFATHIQAFALSFLFGRLQNSLSILHAFWYPDTLEDSFRLPIAALPRVPTIF